MAVNKLPPDLAVRLSDVHGLSASRPRTAAAVAEMLRRLRVLRDDTDEALTVYGQRLLDARDRLTESAVDAPAGAPGTDFGQVITDLGLNPAYCATTPRNPA